MLEQPSDAEDSSLTLSMTMTEIEPEIDTSAGRSVAVLCDSDTPSSVDAETQCEKISTRSIAVQTLAQRKKPRRKIKYSNFSKTSSPMNNSAHSMSNLPLASVVIPPIMHDITQIENASCGEDNCSEHEETVNTIDKSSTESDLSDGSDEDYVCSSPSSSNESDDDKQNTERKFIVFERKLDELFISCKFCSSICEIEKSTVGSMVMYKAICHKNHIFKWKSQPMLHNKPAGNVLIPAATIFIGSTYEPLKQFANALNLGFVNKDQFYNMQDEIVFPVINSTYRKQQKTIIEKYTKADIPIDLCGDGRCDSPGHNAKYGTYTLMEENSGKIVDFSLIQVSEVSSSNAMENEDH
ncbi:uncharacterized protein LOC124456963 [Xenia sp. Carnegie-2017]|uniref:uncharacterized protein LOC124456963 n=1 Tax=Xenia sp. Carnegie-2017 TaxID=2897299 RepID=UPI001F038FE1|nr:uncharacterized protein LOC124456963 [Xenia sp. Carnegie-2017]